MQNNIWSGVESLDKLRIKAAVSSTGCVLVSIEDLNAVKAEVTRLTKQLNACIEDNKHLEKENRGLKDKLKGRRE